MSDGSGNFHHSIIESQRNEVFGPKWAVDVFLFCKIDYFIFCVSRYNVLFLSIRFNTDNTMKKILYLIASAALLLTACGKEKQEVRLLYWNIQNGMWHDQDNNYDNFVQFVKEQDPDICVWCEAESRYRSYTATKMAGCEEAYLPYNWDLLARRYGHNYMVLAGKRDTFPQVVTSKYPLKTVKRINRNGDDIIVVHGAGQVEVEIGDKTLNLVTRHTWPQKYAYLAEDQEASKAEQGGDVFRSVEMKYICEETILQDKDAAKNNWIMLGDFNAISSIDNFHYGIAEDDKQFLVHDYVRNNTPYIDVIEKFYPGDFQPSTQSGRRIDMVYMTEPLFKTVKAARIIRDGYAESHRDTTFRNFCHPSDHYPVVVDMEF